MKMRLTILLACAVALTATAGCSTGEGGGGYRHDPQATFHHNVREQRKWVANPSKQPKFRSQATGAPLFY